MDSTWIGYILYTWIMGALSMPRWKKDATEFVVKVSYEESRGYQSYVPRPVMERLGNPDALKYSIKGKRIEVSSGERAVSG